MTLPTKSSVPDHLDHLLDSLEMHREIVRHREFELNGAPAPDHESSAGKAESPVVRDSAESELRQQLEEAAEQLIEAHHQMVERDLLLAETLAELRRADGVAEGLKREIEVRELRIRELEHSVRAAAEAQEWARHESAVVASLQSELERAQAWARHESESVARLEAARTQAGATALRRRISALMKRRPR